MKQNAETRTKEIGTASDYGNEKHHKVRHDGFCTGGGVAESSRHPPEFPSALSAAPIQRKMFIQN